MYQYLDHGIAKRYRQWYYRGSLKSCNYTCSYCPFSKKRESARQIQEDKRALFRFVDRLSEILPEQADMRNAVLIAPYGEALIHPYYWEALAQLSRNPFIDAVGAQSNFSFSADDMLSVFLDKGGNPEKLRLWGTFHPQMTTADAFAGQCQRLSELSVCYCAGAVGAPERMETLRELREKLPGEVYFWINKMDGMGRNYTPEEIRGFQEIDEYFELELRHHPARPERCGRNYFVEADGSVRRCNISRKREGNFYSGFVGTPLQDIGSSTEKDNREPDDYAVKLCRQDIGSSTEKDNREPDDCAVKLCRQDIGSNAEKDILCGRKECSCFLAYCNQKLEEHPFFYPYPAFRIPEYPAAVFFDVDGTLVQNGAGKISEKTARDLHRLAEHSRIYLATALPYEEAMRKTAPVRDVLSGGVFANGALCLLQKQETAEWEEAWIAEIEDGLPELVSGFAGQYGCRIHMYKKQDRPYKVTLEFPAGKSAFLEKNEEKLRRALNLPKGYQAVFEENCIQILKAGCGKREGVIAACRKMGYDEKQVIAFGNAENDMPLLRALPVSFYITN